MKFRMSVLIICCIAAFAPSAEAAGGASDGATVLVQPGQSLSAIAAQHKVSVAQICQWNHLSSPDKVRAGQKLRISPPDAASDPAAPAAPVASSAPASASSPKSTAKQAKSAKSAPTPAASSEVEMRAPEGVPEKVKLELANTGKILVNNAAKCIMPNIKSKSVTQNSEGYVACYTEVDAAHISTEVIPSAESGKYVGSIRYQEKQYECPGKSKAEALQAECHEVKSRRMNELIRYDKGKWQY